MEYEYRTNQQEIVNVRDIQRELEEERKRLKALEKKHFAEREKQLNDVENLYRSAEQLWDMATMPETFQKRYNDMERRITELISQNQQLSQQLSALQKTTVNSDSYNELVRKYNTAREQISKFQNGIKKLGALGDMELRITELTSQNEQLSKQLSAMITPDRYNAVVRSNNKAVEQIHKLENELARQAEIRKSLQAEIEELSPQIESYGRK